MLKLFTIPCLILTCTLLAHHSTAQVNELVPGKTMARNFPEPSGIRKDIFGAGIGFIENKGQYGVAFPGHESLGDILYGYEGTGAPVLFTKKGIIYFQRKFRREKYRKEKDGRMENEYGNLFTDNIIAIEWLNARSDPEVIAEEILPAYHIYGMIKEKAYAYRTITLKEMYPGIDILYSFSGNKERGFEFSILVKPGADLSKVKMHLGGDTRSVKKGKDGKLIISSAIGAISFSAPVSFYTDQANRNNSIHTNFDLGGYNTIGFQPGSNYDKSKELLIDPFVSTTTTLTGANTGVALDIDFDYAGNVYVAGGDGSFQKLAKYNSAGVLLWTFSGQIASPTWNFGGSYGGWVVEKMSGNIYLAQGLTGPGFKVIRLNPSGLYDNYITTSNANFLEAWKMIWSCNGGAANLMIAGGGGNANNELALLSPPSVSPTASNLSGLTGGHNDISDIVIDPVTDEMYTIYSISVLNPSGDNIIYKHAPPYNASTLIWQKPASYFALHEPGNRPYVSGLNNASNTLAVNSSFLFYWDGQNLKAINKLTGANAGTPMTFATNTKLMQGGIFADECNNVFIGFPNGTIKVLRFNGSVFDDPAVADISIAGFAGSSIYDLAFDHASKLLYACGNGFVTAIDLTASCPSTVYALSVAPDCATLTCVATLSPAPPPGTTVTYAIYDGITLVASNTTGVFTGLNVGVNYTVKAFLNQACSGTQVLNNFTFTSNQSLLTVNDPAAVCLPDGVTDLTVPAVTAGSAAGLTYSYWLDASATIPCPDPTAVRAGTYYIKATAAGGGCYALKPVVVPSLPVPTGDAGLDQSICFGQSTQLNGSGGITYSWTPVTYLDDPNIANPRVISPGPGPMVYHLVITDGNGCPSMADEQVTIDVRMAGKIKVIPFDTIIAVNQPLRLEAVGVNGNTFVNYSWSPSTGLSDPFIYNPVAVTDHDMTYVLTATDAAGCLAINGVHIKVYVGPEIYVPTAFTPGGDGVNDMLRAIPVGIKEFRYFRIYNRWGQLLFTTSNAKTGWDGRVGGAEQSTGVFVWMAAGVDYKGNLISKKGTVTLIR